MAPIESKTFKATAQVSVSESPHNDREISNAEDDCIVDAPAGWKYRTYSLGFIKLPPYASPPFQLTLLALVCFMCPGMFDAVNGLGGGGQFDTRTADNANVALYSTFSVLGFFGGSIANRLGMKLRLCLGGMGYVLYIASYLSYNHNENEGFVVFAGAILGVCAGMLWAAQGAIMMSYPSEQSKGKYISWSWMIFNLGAVIGGLIPLGQNIKSSAGSVTDGTYIGIMVLSFIGACLAWTLVDTNSVIRSDGSHVIFMKYPTWRSELLGLVQILKTDTWIFCLFPMFLASNWFDAYQFNDFNSAKFNIRTRSLNNVLYWLSQIAGAFIFGYALDIKGVRRSLKAKVVWAILLTITMGIWGGGYAWQKGYTRANTALMTAPKNDWTSNGYVGPMILYMFYGFHDAAFQTSIYWFMGAMTNNGRKLALFAGFYMGIQSAGVAILFRVDALRAPFMNEFASSWALLTGSLLLAAPLIWIRIRDTVPIEEDLTFTDETIEDVKPVVIVVQEALEV